MEDHTNIVRNALEFLLFNYFGLTCKDGNKQDIVIYKAVELAYKDATNQGAFNALFTKREFPDREVLGEFKKLVTNELTELVVEKVKRLYGNSKIEFNAWHKELCGQLVSRYREICEKPNNLLSYPQRAYHYFTYGNAQKWVNMTIKNLYVLSGAYLAMDCTENEIFFNRIAARSCEYHIPLDNLILGEIYKQNLIGNRVKKSGKKEPRYYITTFEGSVKGYYLWSSIPNQDVYEDFRKKLEVSIHESAIEWECKNWIERKKRIKELNGDLTNIDDD